eukprot:7597442-Alexandrium_andersonii.AAC.1
MRSNPSPSLDGGSTRLSTPSKSGPRTEFVPQFIEIKGFITDWNNKDDQSLTMDGVTKWLTLFWACAEKEPDLMKHLDRDRTDTPKEQGPW